jgi:lysyl-tRNA synthetase, class II
LSSASNRFKTPQDTEADLSPFKKQRQDEFQTDKESEEPLFPDPYPRLKQREAERKSVVDFLRDFHEKTPDEQVTLMGRVRRKRILGSKLIFVDIVNEFKRVQVVLSKAKMGTEKDRAKFKLFRQMIQVGDHISVTGYGQRTDAGEPSVFATELPQLMSPAMEQIPEKLIDPKTKMQERHVDMLVNREVVDVLRLRAEITKYLRDHLHSKRFLEFQTPILADNAGGAVARPFVTRATGFGSRDLALRIAPELWLKRLVVGGVDKVFEIGPSFRNEGIDATHNPEFTMCEFYSAYSNLSDLLKETEDLICGMADHSHKLISDELTSLPPIDLSRFQRPFKQLEFVPALEEAMGMRLPNLSNENALPELIAGIKLAGIQIPGEWPDSLPKLLDRLAAIYLEPESFREPVFIIHHPACMSPLSKSFLCSKTYQLVSARAELFCGGRELANMYEEENNPQEQDRKMRAHRSLVNTGAGEVAFETPEGSVAVEGSEDDGSGESAPLDASFVKSLDYGLPPTGGWGCGVERLVMLFSGATRISDCLSFGTLKNVVGLSAEEASTVSTTSSSKDEATDKKSAEHA